jgi:lactate racemase
MKARFSFGKSGIEVSVPEGFRTQVIKSHTADAVEDEAAAIGYALDHPIGCAPLVEMARGKKTAAISCAILRGRRRTGRRCLRCWRRLHEAGIPAEGITILIATGLHRGATEDEVKHDCGAGDCGEVSRGEPRC